MVVNSITAGYKADLNIKVGAIFNPVTPIAGSRGMGRWATRDGTLSSLRVSIIFLKWFSLASLAPFSSLPRRWHAIIAAIYSSAAYIVVCIVYGVYSI